MSLETPKLWIRSTDSKVFLATELLKKKEMDVVFPKFLSLEKKSLN